MLPRFVGASYSEPWTSWFRDKSIGYPRKQVTINGFLSTNCIRPCNSRTAGVQTGLKDIACTHHELLREVIFSVTNLSHLLLSHVKKCPKSSGRQDLNLRLLGPKNCRIPSIRRFQSSFPDLNYMECIKFHKPGTTWAHSLEDQKRTKLNEVRSACRSPPGVFRLCLVSPYETSPLSDNS